MCKGLVLILCSVLGVFSCVYADEPVMEARRHYEKGNLYYRQGYYKEAMDGVQAIGKIREFNREVPVIIISAYLEDLKIKEANNYGISGVFYKGKDFQQSMPLIESALRTHKKLKKPDPNPNV